MARSLSTDVEHLRVDANGQTFYCVAAGPPDGEPVVLLHGFPELSYGWRHQVEPLAEAGLRVYAPDQRGYGHSSKPESRLAYVVDTLADDVVALMAELGHPRFSVVGHDWGGIVAWYLGGRRDAAIERLAILNAPNIDVFAAYALAHPLQMLRSTYVAAFQLPWVPEWMLGANDHALLALSLTQSSRPGTFSSEELDVYREAWSIPGALTAMLDWYRAMPLRPPLPPVRIRRPVLIVWGDADVALQSSLAEASAALCDEARVIHVPQAGHWIQHEEADRVNELLVEFLGAGDGNRTHV